MKKSAIACAVLAGVFGFSSLASARDWRGDDRGHDRQQRFEQRHDRQQRRRPARVGIVQRSCQAPHSHAGGQGQSGQQQMQVACGIGPGRRLSGEQQRSAADEGQQR